MGRHQIGMKPNKRHVSGKLIGLVFLIAGAIILIRLVYGDAATSYKQVQLKRDWVSNETGKTSSTLKLYSNKATTNKMTTAIAEENDQLPVIIRPVTSSTIPIKKIIVPTKSAHAELYSSFARIQIPRIKLDEIVVEGVDSKALSLGPGHMEETAWPGEIGNMVISGHRVTHSRPFFYLDELQVGDPIIVSTKSQTFTYNMVKQMVVKPTEVSVIKPTKDRTLTLTTCNPRYSARTRLIIVAKMKD